MENEVGTARDNAELAELESKIAKKEVSELINLEDKESNRDLSFSHNIFA